ncbi:MAG: hypothetical protein P1P84_03460 [Deferrisomatales bacterium]|nr:hypothetical protein [Deferrisomatales bacterium]
MSPRSRNPAPPPGPCPGFEDACILRAWGEPVPEAAQVHIDGCPGCQATLIRARALAEASGELAGAPPERAYRGLAAEVFAATTRREPHPVRRPWALAGAAAGLAVAGLAAVTWWRGQGPAGDSVPDFAAVDLDLLEDLDLAENLDLLEILDALEEMDHV